MIGRVDRTPVSLRPPQASDETLLRVVAVASRETALPDLEPGLLELQVMAARRSRVAQFPAAARQVVLLGDEAVGAVVTAREPRILHLLEIALLPAWRGRGIGSVVLEHLFREADGEGLTVRLSVYRSNPRAHALYRRLGLAEVDADELMFKLERPPAVPLS